MHSEGVLFFPSHFSFWIPLSHSSALGRVFGFIVQIAASLFLLILAAGSLEHELVVLGRV